MTFPTTPGIAGGAEHSLGARERARAVDMIEAAERSTPYCVCGAHMLAVADQSGAVWLESSKRGRERNALQATFAKLTGWTHSRWLVMERPADR